MATVLMIVLGAFALLVNVTIAAILIALGVAMYLFEWWLKRRFSGSATTADSDR